MDGNLDATATYNGQTMLGSFAYTEGSTPVGTTTVSSVGTQTLTATFTPTDTATYTSGGQVTNSIIVTPNMQSTFLSISKSADPLTYSASGQLSHTYTL